MPRRSDPPPDGSGGTSRAVARRGVAARTGTAARRGAAAGPGPARAYLEVGQRRVFAAALDWPGWCRSGRGEEAALETLAAYAERFAPVAARAGLTFSFGAASSFEIVERLPGSGSTEFGVPGAIRPDDDDPIEASELERIRALLPACWSTLSDVVAAAPATLRKGPRGGGRDRDAIAEHVVAAEVEYGRKLGLPRRKVTAADAGPVAEMRAEIAAAIENLVGGGRPAPKGWPARYAARRVAWHVLDHAWEIEDRSA